MCPTCLLCVLFCAPGVSARGAQSCLQSAGGTAVSFKAGAPDWQQLIKHVEQIVILLVLY